MPFGGGFPGRAAPSYDNSGSALAAALQPIGASAVQFADQLRARQQAEHEAKLRAEMFERQRAAQQEDYNRNLLVQLMGQQAHLGIAPGPNAYVPGVPPQALGAMGGIAREEGRRLAYDEAKLAEQVLPGTTPTPYPAVPAVMRQQPGVRPNRDVAPWARMSGEGFSEGMAEAGGMPGPRPEAPTVVTPGTPGETRDAAAMRGAAEIQPRMFPHLPIPQVARTMQLPRYGGLDIGGLQALEAQKQGGRVRLQQMRDELARWLAAQRVKTGNARNAILMRLGQMRVGARAQNDITRLFLADAATAARAADDWAGRRDAFERSLVSARVYGDDDIASMAGSWEATNPRPAEFDEERAFTDAVARARAAGVAAGAPVAPGGGTAPGAGAGAGTAAPKRIRFDAAGNPVE